MVNLKSIKNGSPYEVYCAKICRYQHIQTNQDIFRFADTGRPTHSRADIEFEYTHLIRHSKFALKSNISFYKDIIIFNCILKKILPTAYMCQ